MQQFDLSPYLPHLHRPDPLGTKGDNGRVLVIGGSELFHAASFWSASMASRIVDMVHFTSPAMENNDLMRLKAKEKFWDGIVVPYEEVAHYIQEDDCILIGPGMERGQRTRDIINSLLQSYPTKKWVVDGGALQEVDPTLLTSSMIITPNAKELALLKSKILNGKFPIPSTILAKGPIDTITHWTTGAGEHQSTIKIPGGSPGLTKGGTGDVLAGLVAGFYATSPALASCVVASYTLKSASEELEKSVGPYFSPNDVIQQIITMIK